MTTIDYDRFRNWLDTFTVELTEYSEVVVRCNKCDFAYGMPLEAPLIAYIDAAFTHSQCNKLRVGEATWRNDTL